METQTMKNLFKQIIWTTWLLSSFAFASQLPPSFGGKTVLKSETVKTEWAKAKKGTVEVFLSANCPCSASHEIALKNMYQEFCSKGFQFLGVHSNLDESTELTQDHFSKSDLPFPVIQDPTLQYTNLLNALKTPHAYVISPSGAVVYQGGVDDSNNHAHSKTHYLKAVLAALDQSLPLPFTETRTLGCVIKRTKH